MKLLPKSIINSELASQKKKQIDEGLLIAKKVDALRQTLASLETQHTNFISSMKSELKAQTQPLIDEIASKKLEIKNLSAKREELLVPLTKEWNEVNSKRKEIDKISDELAKERANLKQKQQVLDERIKKEKETSFKINTIKNEITKKLKETEENKVKTELAYQVSELSKERVFRELEEKKQAILERDAKVAVRERETQLLKESLENENKFIREEKIRLADQRATLERAIARTKKC